MRTGDLGSPDAGTRTTGSHTERILNKEVKVLDMEELRFLKGHPFSEVQGYVRKHYPEYRFPDMEELKYLEGRLSKVPRDLQPLARVAHPDEVNLLAFDRKEGDEEGGEGEPIVARLKLRKDPSGKYNKRAEEVDSREIEEAVLKENDVILLFRKGNH